MSLQPIERSYFITKAIPFLTADQLLPAYECERAFNDTHWMQFDVPTGFALTEEEISKPLGKDVETM